MSNSDQIVTGNYDIDCTSHLETTTEQFIWTIENFSQYNEMKCGECLRSTEFTSTTPNGQLLKWQMRMYPNGIEEESTDYIEFCLKPINALLLIKLYREKMEAKYQFSIRKPNGYEFKFNKIDHNIGSYSFIKRGDLFNEKNGYLDGDRLTLVCTLIIQQEVKSSIEVPECQVIQEDLGHLFESGQFTDCKVTSADDKEFKVHKCILGCRSPVFGAMFEHEVTENIDDEIIIPDINGDVIELMLRFIYSGKEPADWGEMAGDLLFAADKYGLIRLKILCERKLINSLENANACELLQLANLHSAEQLKANALDFIKMHLKEVMESEGWMTWADEQLKDQILVAVANS